MKRNVTTAALLGLLCAGFALAQDAPATEPPRIVRTIEMDPENPRDFRGWWISKESILHVDGNGGYQRWEGIDRFHKPREVGRWHQRNHAVILLESYAIPKRPASRLSLWLRNGGLMADLSAKDSRGRQTVYQKSAEPPRVPEDELIGTWQGPGGVLHLHPDLTYTWHAPEGSPAAPAAIASQRGEFSYRNRELRMVPLAHRQAPAIESVAVDEDKRITLMRSRLGEMRRQPRPAPLDAPVPQAQPTPDSPAKVTDNSAPGQG